MESINKEQVIKDILSKAQAYFDADAVQKLEMLLVISLKDIELTTAVKALTVSTVDNDFVIKRFLVTKKLEGCSERTLRLYNDEVRRFFQSITKSFYDIQTNDIRYFLALRMQSGCKKITIDNTRRFLSSFFKFLTEEELILKNPIMKIKKVKIDKTIKRAFTPEDIEKIKTACATDRERALVEVLLSTACRVGEISGLTLEAIDWDHNKALVFGKGAKERIVYLNASSKLWLKKYLSTRKYNCKYAFSADTNRGFRAEHVGGEDEAFKLGVSQIEHIINKIGKRAGVSNCHPHRFRRTAATLASERGMPLEQIKKLLGHEDIATTLIYTTASNKDVQYSHEKYLG